MCCSVGCSVTAIGTVISVTGAVELDAGCSKAIETLSCLKHHDIIVFLFSSFCYVIAGNSKIFAKLGFVCKCCDGIGGSCTGTTQSCNNLANVLGIFIFLSGRFSD
ncbi:hypothetical protein MTR_4g029470 [Medicago truncatula]|uniref:Uncharacterized protein n=1 Tax=Medicago truncatula TaxID=3880 RepID=G7JJK8_MEDTR|nr:hypothetical protein MTR_4g029470 [Medicago truncatula]